MKIHLPLALVGLAISFASPTFAQQTNTLDPQIIEQLNASTKKIDEAFNNGDAAALSAIFTEDAVLVTDRGPIYGREAIEEYHAGLFMQFHFRYHLGKRDQYSPHIQVRLAMRFGASGNGVRLCKARTPETLYSSRGAIGRRLVFVRAILGRIG